MNAYAYLCGDCRHLLSGHLLHADGTLVDGPYICSECGCSQPQDSPTLPLTRAQYHDFLAGSSGKQPQP